MPALLHALRPRLPRSHPARAALAIATLAAFGLAAWLWPRGTAAGFRLAPLDRGAVVMSVAATGTVQPVERVEVGSQVSGRIVALAADFNAKVRADQVIARLDAESFEARVKQQEAALAIAEARQASAEAAMAQAEVALRDAERSAERYRALRAQGLVSEGDLDAVELKYEQARANAATAAAELKVAAATILQARASLDSARTDLRNTFIRSPVDGVVIARKVEVGQTVAASLQAPVLFEIARDLARMRVEASVDEADIGAVREGQTARFTVDAYAGREFAGRVTQVRKTSTTTQNVVTYTVIVEVANDDLALLPGMTATVSIETAREDGVLRVPVAALRFKPRDEELPPGFAERPRPAPSGGTVLGAPTAPAATQNAGGDRQQTPLRAILRALELDEAQRDQLRGLFAAGGGRGGRPDPDAFLAKLRPILTDAQRAKLDALLGAGQGTGQRGRLATVWTPGPKGRLAPAVVRIGASDLNHAAVLGGTLAEGATVVVGREQPAQ